MDKEWEAATPENLATLLEMTDEILAERQVPVAERPLLALTQLVSCELIAGSDGLPIQPNGFAITESDAFKPLAKMIGEWYRQQYGQTTMAPKKEKLAGFVLVRRSPFLLEVPANLLEPGDEPDTVWLRFTERVLAEEDVLKWISHGPNLHGLADISNLQQDITKVANDLRFIHIAALGILTKKDASLNAFVQGVGTHLEQAAHRVVKQKTQDVVESYWDMQMAAEIALKGLLLHKNGTFPYSHSLRKLVAAIVAIDASFPADCLGNFPDDHETVNRRYGKGNVSWGQTFADYLMVLALVRNAMKRMERIELGNASFCIRKAPWA